MFCVTHTIFTLSNQALIYLHIKQAFRFGKKHIHKHKNTRIPAQHSFSPTIRSEPKSWFSSFKPIKKSTFSGGFFLLAASPGLEPRLTESESAVLPLDDEAKKQSCTN